MSHSSVQRKLSSKVIVKLWISIIMCVCVCVCVCVPCRCSLEVSEVCMQDTDAVITHHIDEVYISKPGSQLPNHLPPVLWEHGVQLALIAAQRDVPRQDIVSVGIVEHWRERERERGDWNIYFVKRCMLEAYLQRKAIHWTVYIHWFVCFLLSSF